MRKSIAVVVFSVGLAGVQLSARDVEQSNLKERFAIDQSQPTLLMFPDLVQASLAVPGLEFSSMTEGDTSKIWKATPHCEKKCEDIDVEFITVAGKHIALHLKVETGIKDHVLSVNEAPTNGAVEGTRQRLPQLAREAFLRVVRGWPPFPKTEEAVPDSVKKLADSWDGFRTDQFLIYVGKSLKASKKEIETLTGPSVILIGTFDESVVVISRRKP